MKKASLLSVLAAFCLCLSGFSADPPATATTEHGHDKAEWMKLTVPGESHKALTDIVGKFNFTSKFWMAPDAKAEESKGTSTSKWAMGGRFVQQDVKSKMMGQKFEGMGFTGYDTVKKEYQSVWLDNMGTGIMWSTGAMDTATKTLATTGTYGCPMTGDQAKFFRTELKVTSPKEHTYAMYSKTADGKEFKTMEITYTRTK